MSEKPKSSAGQSIENYNHQEVYNEVEKLNSQFEEMKETLICLNVRAHKLEADIAQMFDPCLAESLHKLEQNCESCKAAINASM